MQDIHGGNIWKWQEALNIHPLDFSASINPLGPPQGVFRVITENLSNLVHYPDPENRRACQALSEYHGIDSSHIIFGNGAMELLYLLPRALLLQSALIPIPTFSGYEKALLYHAVQAKFVNWWVREEGKKDPLPSPSPLAFLSSAAKGVQGVFICHPNNPTGEVLEKGFLLNLLDFCEEQKIWLILDEAFIDFLDQPDAYSLIQEAVSSTRLVVIRSLTKFFALPGLRLGYGVGPQAIIQRLKQEQLPWSVNVLAQQIVNEILKDEAYARNSRKFIQSERAFLLTALSEMEGIQPVSGSVNFLLCRLTCPGWTSPQLTTKLIQSGILIRDCSTLRGLNEQYFRIAVRTREENRKLLSTLQEVLSE
jgi:threonine-phosphate decarboxylase